MIQGTCTKQRRSVAKVNTENCTNIWTFFYFHLIVFFSFLLYCFPETELVDMHHNYPDCDYSYKFAVQGMKWGKREELTDVLVSSLYRTLLLCFYLFSTLEMANQGTRARETGAHPLHGSVTYSYWGFLSVTGFYEERKKEDSRRDSNRDIWCWKKQCRSTGAVR